MATVLGTVYLTNSNYQLAYDLLSQNTVNNTSNVRLYGILNVTGSYISWTRGSASVHTSGLQSIGTYYGKGSHILITRDFTFTHDANGNFSAYIGASLSTTYVSGDTGGILTLPQIKRFATITDSPESFTDEENPWFSFTNPANASMSCWLEPNPNGAHLAERKLSGGNGTFTWDLTEEERDQLRNACKNANSCVCRIGLYSTIGNSTNASFKDRTLKIINANPDFYEFEWEDVNQKTIELTGDNKSIINGYSNIKITIPTDDIAIAKKQAILNKYRANIGTISNDFSYSETEQVEKIIPNVDGSVINVYAIDSRNNSTLVTKQAINFYNYTPLVKGEIFAYRNDNGVGETVTLKYNGTFNKINFGKKINTITSATYMIRKLESKDIIKGETDITPNISGNSFEFEGLIAGDEEDLGFDLNNSYEIIVNISDELTTVTYTVNISSGTPNIALAKTGVSIMSKYDDDIGGLLQIGGKKIEDYLNGKIYEEILTSPKSSISIPCDIIRDGGHYRLIVLGKLKNGKSDVYITFNDIPNGYYQSGVYWTYNGSYSDSSGTGNTGYRPDKKGFYYAINFYNNGVGRFEMNIDLIQPNDRVRVNWLNTRTYVNDSFYGMADGCTATDFENVNNILLETFTGDSFAEGTKIILTKN